MDVSPQLFAIQSLAGQTASDKYKELHSIAAQIIANDEERTEFLNVGTIDRVQPALLPYLRILIGDKLKLSDFVIEALKSSDVYIIKQALRAKWFFNESNPLITVEFLATNLSFMALRTRLELIKTLARRCLMNDTKKAEEFFKFFVNEYYDYKQAMPILVACSDDFIIDTILKYEIILPRRILSLLYPRRPQLVIRYLKLGFREKEKNEERRGDYDIIYRRETPQDKIYSEISSDGYERFMCTLIKNNLNAFIEINKKCTGRFKTNYRKKLGRKRAEYYFQNGMDFFLENSKLFLTNMPLEFVKKKLGAERLEILLKDYFIDYSCFSYRSIKNNLRFIASQPKEIRLDLLITFYQSIEEKDLLNDDNIFNFPEIFQLIPSDVQERMGRNSVAQTKNIGSLKGAKYYSHLPPRLSIPALKLNIAIPTDEYAAFWIEKMIESCYLYGDKEALADALICCDQQHVSDEDGVVDRVLTKLCSRFDVKSLDEKNWEALKNILLKTHIKGQIAINEEVWIQLLEGALEFYLKKYKTTADTEDEKVFLSFFSKYLEHVFEKNVIWNFQPQCSKIKWDYIHLLLSEVSTRYPESSPVWNTDTKLTFAIHVLELLIDLKSCDLNVELKNQYANEIKSTILKVESNHWLMKYIKSLIDNKPCLVEALQSYDPTLREALTHKKPIAKVTKIEALHVLKSNYKSVLDRWQDYLDDCRASLVKKRQKSTRNFVAATKWYQDLPMKFVNQCLLEIEKEGSTLVLGILLEGEVLSRILEPYIPKNEQTKLEDEDSKKEDTINQERDAQGNTNDKNSDQENRITPEKKYKITSSLPASMNFANPPVALEVLRLLRKAECTQRSLGTLLTTGRRLPANKVIEFAKSLVSNDVSETKVGMHLALQVGSIKETCVILVLIWSQARDLSFRRKLAKRIYSFFRHCPNDHTYEMMKAFINGLTGHTYDTLRFTSTLTGVDFKYICQVIEVWTDRMDDLIMVETLDKSQREFLKSNALCRLEPRITRGCPDDVITNIIKKNFFMLHFGRIKDIYLFIDQHKFESRLNVIMEILEKQLKLNELDPEGSYFEIEGEILNIFRYLTDEVEYENKQMWAKLFDRLLTLYSKFLRAERSPEFFIKFTLFKNYLEAKDAKAFGTKCAKDIPNLLEYFGSDIVFSIIAKSLEKMNENVSNQHVKESVLVSAIKGLVGFWYVNAKFNGHKIN